MWCSGFKPSLPKQNISFAATCSALVWICSPSAWKVEKRCLFKSRIPCQPGQHRVPKTKPNRIEPNKTLKASLACLIQDYLYTDDSHSRILSWASLPLFYMLPGWLQLEKLRSCPSPSIKLNSDFFLFQPLGIVHPPIRPGHPFNHLHFVEFYVLHIHITFSLELNCCVFSRPPLHHRTAVVNQGTCAAMG